MRTTKNIRYDWTLDQPAINTWKIAEYPGFFSFQESGTPSHCSVCSSLLKGFDSMAAGLRSSDHNKNIGIYRRLFRGDE